MILIGFCRCIGLSGKTRISEILKFMAKRKKRSREQIACGSFLIYSVLSRESVVGSLF